MMNHQIQTDLGQVLPHPAQLICLGFQFFGGFGGAIRLGVGTEVRKTRIPAGYHPGRFQDLATARFRRILLVDWSARKKNGCCSLFWCSRVKVRVRRSRRRKSEVSSTR